MQNMETSRMFWVILLLVTMTYDNVSCTDKEINSYEITHEGEKYRVYLEAFDRKCLWTGNAPFCFISAGCPPRMTTVKTDKFGDGAYCWIGFKVYCCLSSSNSTRTTD